MNKIGNKIMKRKVRLSILTTILTTLLIGLVFNQTTIAQTRNIIKNIRAAVGKNKDYSPYANLNYPVRVYWGDAHLHSSFSPDAGLAGNHLDPNQAFRLAKGEQVVTSSGQSLRLEKPYDWLVISDHAEYFGLPQAFREKDPDIMQTKSGKKWAEALKKGGSAGYEAFAEMTKDFAEAKPSIPQETLTKLYHKMWKRSIEAAEKNNQPGVFSALTGFEWTQSIKGNNLHRTVIFRDGINQTSQILPFSEFDSTDPQQLWQYMANYENMTGGRVLAVEHNSNLSGGLMFAPKTWAGLPFTQDYATMRAKFDRVVEVTQSKGDSETTPELSPEDSFADFERWNKANIFGLIATTPNMLPYNYVRSALKIGLQYETKLGVNPFKFGFVGGSDEHTSLSTTRAENYFGVGALAEPKAKRWQLPFVKSVISPKLNTHMWEMAPGGLTGVWAAENTREAIWDALYRREIFATSGTRITVRVFAGWDFVANDLSKPEPLWVKDGYSRGVPMGASLTSAPSGKSPTFMIKANCDSDGAYLDRIQIIKGWLDDKGETHEKIFDVAWSGNRQPDLKTGELPSVGNTVDIQNATWTNDIGAPVLQGFWKDPYFNPNEAAFYYVRVIEIPTPRWTAYDAKRFKIKMDNHVPMIVTNRAYTSPIWYF